MARISLFDNINKNAFELSLLSAEDLLAAIPAEQNDPNAEIEEDEVELVIQRTDETIDESSELAEIAVRTSATLEDTAYMIAPTIPEARASDVALIRQIASTSAANLGMSDEDMFQANDQLVEGQAIVLEGFKERAAQALYAVWVIIANIAEQLFKLLQMLFKNLVVAYNKIVGIATAVNKGERHIKQLDKPTENMVNMFPNAKSANAMFASKHIEQLAGSASGVDSLFKQVADINKKVADLTDLTLLPSILDKYLLAIKSSLNKVVFPESGGKEFVIQGLDAVENERDAIKAYTLVKNIRVEAEMTVAGEIENANIFKDDNELKGALTSYLNVFRTIDPSYFHMVEALAGSVERTAKLNGMKIKTKWGDMLDKLPEADRETIRPYVGAVSEMARLSTVLSTKILRASVRQYADAVFAAAKYFNAVTEKA
ncbi:TPA: hypothetical protein O8L85_002388 [Enterobacter hormaechei]|nr:hypothetical protein [Enterobacter hormaechei]